MRPPRLDTGTLPHYQTTLGSARVVSSGDHQDVARCRRGSGPVPPPRLVVAICADKWLLSCLFPTTSRSLRTSESCAAEGVAAPRHTEQPSPGAAHEPSPGHTDFRHHTRVRTHVPRLKLSANATTRAPTPQPVPTPQPRAPTRQ